MQPTALLRVKFRKLPLTTKDINKGFYKGNRTGTVGRHTKFGGFIIDWSKVRTYVVPEIPDEFSLTPFVAQRIDKFKASYNGYKGPTDPLLYLDKWKTLNGRT